MSKNGNLADFSLAEILQFLDQGKKTGLLYIEYLQESDTENKEQSHYIWLRKGSVIAASERSDQQGLLLMINQRGWINESFMSEVYQTSPCFIDTPMGLCLKSEGILQSEQLKTLFNNQVLRPICNLFQVKNGTFKFDPIPFLPLGEMTGLSMPGTEVILTCLRCIKDWKVFEDKLPESSIGLSSVRNNQPDVRLNSKELQVWKFVDSPISLEEIASQLKMSIQTVQQIAFRLIITGLAEENFLVAASAPSYYSQFTSIPKFIKALNNQNQKPTISQSFLENLVGFLRAKAS